MAGAGHIVAETLALVRRSVRPGVSTLDLDGIAEAFIRSHPGALPSFKGLYGFPKTLCTSVNDEVVHGIPGARALQEGDVVGIDCGAVVGGYYGDAARTLAVGAVNAETARLLEATKKALLQGIAAARAGGRVSDTGAAIEAVAIVNGYGVVRDFVGHGVGTALHEEPQVPNYGPAGRGSPVHAGMVLVTDPAHHAARAARPRSPHGASWRACEDVSTPQSLASASKEPTKAGRWLRGAPASWREK